LEDAAGVRQRGDNGVYTIELLLFGQNSEKLRVYVLIVKNYHKSFQLFQIALIRN
jgi:hypothetical protein